MNISKATKVMKVAFKMLPKRGEPQYREITPEEAGLSFSTPYILLNGPFIPTEYTVRLTSDRAATLRVESREPSSVQISPGAVSLSQRNKLATIKVVSTESHNQEIDLIHYEKGSDCYCTLKLFVLGPEGIHIRTAGSDEYFQLSHEYSQKRFSDQIEAVLEKTDYKAKRTTILRPTAEIIFNNDSILQIQEGGKYCYPEYPYWVDVSAGDLHNLACTSDGRLYSWGTGLFGQLGVPLQDFVDKQAALIEEKAKKHWQQAIHDLVLQKTFPNNLREAIEASCRTPYIPVTPELLRVPMASSVQAVACGQYHSIVLSEGRAFSFGLGDSGRLGLGDEETVETPTLIALPGRCQLIAAGYSTSFFVMDSRVVLSCGHRSEGSLGHDSQKLTPTQIPFLNEVIQISSAYAHTAVVTLNGTAVLFGSNEDNRLGGSSPHTLANIEGRKIWGIYCGGRHTCALTEDLEVYAWGHNSSGQLGLSSTMFHSMTSPVKIEYLSGRFVVKLALGWEHSCAITADGLLYCWGSNSKGQLAVGTLAKEFNRVGLPRLIDHMLGHPVSCIAASKSGSIFLDSEGDTDKSSDLFTSWKHSLLIEEKHRQELANYRFSLLIRDLKRSQLVNKIQKERDSEFSRPAKQRRVSCGSLTGQGYSSFWGSKSAKQTGNDRVIYRFVKNRRASVGSTAGRRRKRRTLSSLAFGENQQSGSYSYNPGSLVFSKS